MENEYYFLYCCLNNNEALKEIPHLQKHIFSDPITQQVFEIISQLLKKGFLPNMNTIKGYLDDGSYEIFSRSITHSINLSDYHIYLDSIKNSYSYGQLEKAGAILDNGIINKTDPIHIANSIQEYLKAVYFSKNVGSIFTPKELVDKIVTEMAGDESSVYLGLPELDKLTGPIEPGNIIIVAARPSMGKCLGKGTKILLFNGGFKNVEDIIIGDILMGPDSTPRKVLSTTTGIEQMYWVHQKKGISYRVNESHILSLKRSRNEYKYKNGDILNISVKEYLNKSNKFKSNYKGYMTGVEFTEKQIEIDPYFLGIWLGDGDTDYIDVSNPDIEIIDEIKRYADSIGLIAIVHKYGTECPVIRIRSKLNNNKNHLIDKMREYGLFGNKHIPFSYLYNTKKIRLKLLAGIVDSDGFFQKESNIIEIIQKNENLAKSIKILANSLGFRVSLSKTIKSIKSIGFTGEYYRLIISGDLTAIPTKVVRKTATISPKTRDWKNTAIDIEKDTIDNYFGFELDGDGLFLLEDMTVTHNSAMLIQILINQSIYGGQPTALFSFEMGAKAIMRRVIANVAGISLTSIRLKKLTERQAEVFNSVKEQIENSPLHIIDNTYTVSGMEANLELLKNQYPSLSFVGLDYLQLIENTNEGIANMMKELKRIGKRLELRWIMASQLSRLVEQREEKRPMMSDLRDSGSLEQDADIIIFPFRESYYDKAKAVAEGHKSPMELIIAKNRDGETGTVYTVFDKNIQRFSGYKGKNP